MKHLSSRAGRGAVLAAALQYSFPVFLGYLAIGTAFGLLLSGAGYPIWFALFMSAVMYAGAGQYIAVGLFAAGTSIPEACLIQLVVNARHIAYGFSMLSRFPRQGPLRSYLIFSMTDETFALLSSLPPDDPPPGKKRERFMFYVSLLDQGYWIAGSITGAAAGHLIPFSMEGISFALTALFIVLMIEQIFRYRKPGVFIVSAAAALFAVFLLPYRISLLAGMVLALVVSFFLDCFSGRPVKERTL